MAEDQAAFARLGEDAGVGFVAANEILGAKARVLFIGDERQQDLAGKFFVGQRGGGAKNRGGAAFHIVAAAAVDPAVFDARLKRGNRHPGRADGIEMSAENERRSGVVADLRHGVWAARRCILEPCADAARGEPVAGHGGNGRFAVGFGRGDARIHRRRANETFERGEDFRARQGIDRHENSPPSGARPTRFYMGGRGVRPALVATVGALPTVGLCP